MIKRYKRKNSGFMRRNSRIYLTMLNRGKAEKLYSLASNYANVVRYFVEMFWSIKDFSNELPDKTITDRAVKRFAITARLSQLAAKQAKEMVNSQRKRSNRKKRMPRFKKISINLDSRFFTLTRFNGYFDWALKFSSGLPSVIVPFNNTKHTFKTSQRCPICGNIDRRNRNADKFKCTNCAFEENADIVGAMNLKALGLAGVHSLRLLQTSYGYLSIK